MTAILRSYVIGDARVCAQDGGAAIPFEVKTAQIVFDKSWTPYCQMRLTLGGQSAAQVAAMDPRIGLRVRFTLAETETDGNVLTGSFDLSLRSRQQTWSTGELELTASSDEALMQDYGYLTPQTPNALPLGPGSGAFFASAIAAGAVQTSLNRSLAVAGSAPDIAVDGDDASAEPGQSAWDWAADMAEAAGAWLWCDENGQLRWTDPGYAAITTPQLANDADAVIDVLDIISRDDPAWATAVVLEYTLNSPTQYLVSSAGVEPRKTITLTRNRRRPSNGSATKPRQQAQNHGRSLQVTAAANILARPNQTWQIAWLGQAATGVVQSASFDYPEGRMSLLINI